MNEKLHVTLPYLEPTVRNFSERLPGGKIIMVAY